jgi:hypothetical protein
MNAMLDPRMVAASTIHPLACGFDLVFRMALSDHRPRMENPKEDTRDPVQLPPPTAVFGDHGSSRPHHDGITPPVREKVLLLRYSRITLVLFRMRRRDERLRRKKDGGVAFEKAVRRKPLAFAADAGLSMEFQSISARKSLPEAGSRK